MAQTDAQRLWYLRNKEKIKEFNQTPGQKEKRRLANLKYDRSVHGRITRSAQDRRNSRSPKRRAREALRRAIRDGKFPRGTCHCGKVGHGHHEDYSKPLDVIWLCGEHHKERHEEISRVEHSH